MNNRARYYTTILEKVASPLLQAVMTRADSAETADPMAQAQTMAGLIAQAVKTSIAFGEIIDIGAMGEQTDSMRVALAGLASPLVANHFTKTGKPVEEGDIKTLTMAMQAALGFAENFTPTPENIARLATLEPSAAATDIPQIQAQYMRTLAPIIQAVQEFSFGHQPGKLITDITAKLTTRAEHIAGELAGTEDELSHKRAALPVLAALATLYTNCHAAEVTRIQALDDDARAALPKDGNGFALKTLWDNYDLQFALLETLIGSILGDEVPEQAGQGTSTEAPTPPPVETPAAPTEGESSSNPMSMFAKKPEGDTPPPDAPEAPSPPPAEAAPSSDEPAAANPMSMFTKKPDADAPPPAEAETPAAPAETPPPTETEDTPPASGGEGPMSFFTAPKDKGDE